MPFRPHHGFQNRIKLERLVTTLHATGQVPENIFENFHRYHPAMIHKLKSAKYSLDKLGVKLTTTAIPDAADMTGDFMFEVNMFIDGFFYSAGSALDILARVVLTLFGQPVTGQVYFQTAYTDLNQARPGDSILHRLDPPAWRRRFSDYRNTLAHELVILTTCVIEIDTAGVTPTVRIVFPLPDDPRASPAARTYRQNPDALKYVSQHFTRILRIANTVYGDIATRAETSGQLPL